MNETTSIRTRVETFIREYGEWNNRHYKDFDFSQWDAVEGDFVRKVLPNFSANVDASKIGKSIGTPPAHSPESESIDSIELTGRSKAVAKTSSKSAFQSYEYALRKEQREWRIESIQAFSTTAGELATNDPDLSSLRTAKPKVIPATDFPLGFEKLFYGPRRIHQEGRIVQTTVKKAGALKTKSGFLACGDPGYWTSGLEILKQRVPAGIYPIQLVVGGELRCVAALRIQFAPLKSKTHFVRALRACPGFPDSKESHIVGVDGGIVSIGDAESLRPLKARDRELISHNLPTDKPYSWSKIGDTRLFTVMSGYGDGGYPGFWEIDKDDRIISFFLDFGVLGTTVYKESQIAFSFRGKTLDIKGDPKLCSNIRIEVDRSGESLSITTQHSTEATITDESGNVLFDSRAAGVSICERTHTYQLPNRLPPTTPLLLKVKSSVASEYIFET